MLKNNGIYIIVDFEATCSDIDEFPREEMEIIEIGAIAVNMQDFKKLGEFDVFVKPVLHPKLTEFCKSLTSIRQEDIDKAKSFPENIKQFNIWLAQYENPIFSSWGNYDKNQLKKDCEFNKTPYPFNEEHINLKELFSKQQNMKKRYGIGKALKMAELEFQGIPHRGIDDVRNILRLFPYIFGEKTISGF